MAALLLGGEGEGLVEFAVLSAATEKLISRHQHWYTVPAPDVPVHLLQRLKRCTFPMPGQYVVSLRFDGDILAQRHLDLFQLHSK
jgi:hypothetical protein